MRITSLAMLGAAACLAGCAAEIRQLPAQFAAVPSPAVHLRLTRAVEAMPESGYRRTIAADSRFVHAGRIAQGEVYKPLGGVVLVEGRHVHEAWPVLRGESLVGFYLPVEQSFSPLGTSVPFPFQQLKE